MAKRRQSGQQILADLKAMKIASQVAQVTHKVV
jgi:hypothetical protein